MTRQEFAIEMRKLIEVFGPDEYPKARMDDIFEDVQDLSAKWFAGLVKQFRKDKPIKYPPLPNEFNTAAQIERKRRQEYASNDVAQAAEDHRGPEAMQRICEQFGVNSMTEAIGKIRLVKDGEGA